MERVRSLLKVWKMLNFNSFDLKVSNTLEKCLIFNIILNFICTVAHFNQKSFSIWNETFVVYRQRSPLNDAFRCCSASGKVLVLLSPSSADHEWLQRASDHRQGRLRRGVRLQEGRHGEDVRRATQKTESELWRTLSRCDCRCVICAVCRFEWKVRHEVFGQEEDQDEAGGDSSAQWKNHAVVSQHRGELVADWTSNI